MALSGAGGNILKWWQVLLLALAAIAVLVYLIYRFFGNIWNTLTAPFASLGDIPGQIASDINSVISPITGALGAAGSTIAGTAGSVISTVTGVPGAVGGAILTAGQDAQADLTASGTAAGTAAGSIASTLYGAGNDIFQAAAGLGTQFGKEFSSVFSIFGGNQPAPTINAQAVSKIGAEPGLIGGLYGKVPATLE